VGPGQRGQYGMVLPRFVEASLKNEDLLVHGDGSQTRCFCHVHDVVRALAALMGEPACSGEVYNVGGTDEIRIRDLAERTIRRCNSRSKVRLVAYQEIFGDGFEDMKRRVPCIDKIRGAVGWQPQIDLDRIIDETAGVMRGA